MKRRSIGVLHIGLGLTGLLLATSAVADVTEVWRTTGFISPESVEWDAAAGLAYVSNMGADPMAADGDGYISTIGADGVVMAEKWVAGLNAPKGMAAVGGKLYTSDLTDLVEIDTATGAITNRYPAAGAVFLNDVTAAPDGRIFVSDTFGNSVWVLENGAMSMFAQDPALMGANGLTVIGNALVVANLGDASAGFDKIKPGWVVSIDLTSRAIAPYGSTDPSGTLDGVEPDGKGGVLFTDNFGGRLMQQAPGGAAAELAKLEPGAADMDFVPDQGLILVPLTPGNTVVGLKWAD
jgi:hypothetical protein